ncbi:sugar transferase [Fibrella arboris]|uniref:sugar transferase n=1 Tax=Fibrella arboris TaxID=3242486 RepID=UPI0035225BEB
MLSLDTAVNRNRYFMAAESALPVVVEITWYERYGKRIFDIVVASFVLVFMLSWMIPIIGIAIRLSSPGPMLFRQKRSGRHGREFWCLKFRSMYHRPRGHFAQCEKNDPRVTSIGAFLRRSNLDEMPQFLNVLMGDMSIVGPRPHAVQHDDRYWFTMPNYHVRYQIRPGITGLAQVRGARGETDKFIKMKHRVEYDKLYVRKQSFLVDIKLCIATIAAMLKGNVNAW